MRYFTPSEFRGWYRKMDPRLLDVMDRFRAEWGDVVIISPAEGALGRRLNPPSKSFHNINKWGKVMAVDLMPRGLDSGAGYKRAFECGVKAGALGIGVYADWRPQPGVHLDVGERPGRGEGNPARWSAFRVNGRQQYFAIEKAFDLP